MKTNKQFCKFSLLIVLFFLIFAAAQGMESDATRSKSNISEHLIEASKKGNIDLVKSLLKSGADINYRDETKRTPLLWAFQMDREDIALLLLDEGANPNFKDQKKQNIFFKAALRGNKSLLYLASTILSHFDVNMQDIQGMTPLMFATLAGHIEIVQELILNYGATPYITNQKGNSAFDYALEQASSHPEILQFFYDQNLFQDQFFSVAKIQKVYRQKDTRGIKFIKQLLHYKKHSIIDNIRREDCLVEGRNAIDYSNHFIKVYDQKETPLCWAFSSIALLEEAYYLKTGRKIQFSLPYYLMEVDPDLLKLTHYSSPQQGRSSFESLATFFEKGAFLVNEKESSYEDMLDAFTFGAPQFLLRPFDLLPPHSIYQLQDMSVQTVGDFDVEDDLRKRARSLKYALLYNKKSVGVILGSVSHAQHILDEKNSRADAHAVIITGMRWNDNKNRCELNIKNSWGSNDHFQGWKSAYKILLETDNFFYLRDEIM